MNCPKCKKESYRKDGFVNKQQRYFCKTCNFRYSVVKKSGTKCEETKPLTLEMCLEGLGFRAMGRLLNINYTTVHRWVEKWGKNIEFPQKKEIEIAEIDELHTYIGSKKTTVGYGLLLIDLVENSSIFCVDAGVLKQVKNEWKI